MHCTWMQCIIRGMANDTQLVIRMPAELKAALIEVAAIYATTPSDLVRTLLTARINTMARAAQEDAIDD